MKIISKKQEDGGVIAIIQRITYLECLSAVLAINLFLSSGLGKENVN